MIGTPPYDDDEMARQLGQWILRAMAAQDRATYYCNLLTACAEAIGPDAYTTDAEGPVPDWNKIPQRIADLRRRNTERRRRLGIRNAATLTPVEKDAS